MSRQYIAATGDPNASSGTGGASRLGHETFERMPLNLRDMGLANGFDPTTTSSLFEVHSWLHVDPLFDKAPYMIISSLFTSYVSLHLE